jgi:hypothetical protein
LSSEALREGGSPFQKKRGILLRDKTVHIEQYFIFNTSFPVRGNFTRWLRRRLHIFTAKQSFATSHLPGGVFVEREYCS